MCQNEFYFFFGTLAIRSIYIPPSLFLKMPPKKKEEPAPKTVLLGRPGTSLKMGIVGLPNVGKSSFFNLLTKQTVAAENFPFCTIEPNQAKVPVPDARYEELCRVFKPRSEVPTMLHVTDIAGLVKGAAEGQGLGNAFLSHIGAVDGIYHMVRVFEDEMITHVEGEVNPIRDVELIFNELVIKDLENVTQVMERIQPIVDRGIDKTKVVELEYLKKIKEVLERGDQIRCCSWNAKEIEFLNTLHLLTAKPGVFLINMTQRDFLRKRNKWLPQLKSWIDARTGEPMIPFSVEHELQLQEKAESEKPASEESPEARSSVSRIVTEGYRSIHLLHFFTAGEDEVRCWTIQKGMKAPQAAGRIHSDMEKGFICADTVHWADFEETKDMSQCKEAGKLRQEGKTYEVLDGDILHFKFNPPRAGSKKN